MDIELSGIVEELGDDHMENTVNDQQKDEASLTVITEEMLSKILLLLIKNETPTKESRQAFHQVSGLLQVKDLAFLETCLDLKSRFPNAAAEKSLHNFTAACRAKLEDLTKIIRLSTGDCYTLCMTVFQHLLNENYKKPGNEDIQAIRPIKPEGKDILHHVRASVLHKIKQSLLGKEVNQSKLDILNCLTTKKPSQAAEPQSLTSLLDRGGLTYITPTAVECFVIMEHAFRSTEVSCTAFIEKCMANTHLILAFCDCTQKVATEEKDKKHILEAMVKLFFEIRVHPKCKQMMDKYRLDKKVSVKAKGLRKTLTEQS